MPLPPFEIAVEANTLRVVLRGFWSVSTADAYNAELLRAAGSLGSRRSCWLIDCADFPIQAAEVAGAVAKGVGMAKQGRSPAVAIVSKSALTALQARRAGQASDQAHFSNQADAEAWLREQMAA